WTFVLLTRAAQRASRIRRATTHLDRYVPCISRAAVVRAPNLAVKFRHSAAGQKKMAGRPSPAPCPVKLARKKGDNSMRSATKTWNERWIQCSQKLKRCTHQYRVGDTEIWSKFYVRRGTTRGRETVS